MTAASKLAASKLACPECQARFGAPHKPDCKSQVQRWSRAMTVGQLVEQLQKLPPSKPVVVEIAESVSPLVALRYDRMSLGPFKRGKIVLSNRAAEP